MTYTVGLVTLDGMVTALAEYDPDDRWNGWLCPSFDALVAVGILEALAAHSPHDPPHWFDFIDGVLNVCDRYDEHGYIEEYPPDSDGLYPLGAYGWVWSATVT